MLNVVSLEQARIILAEAFPNHNVGSEFVDAAAGLGRFLAENIIFDSYVPGFTRSTVDGYAVRASDTNGCSESLPSLLKFIGSVEMGKACDLLKIAPGECVYVPTGGILPDGADAVVMLEYSEDLGDDDIAVTRPVAAGANLIFRGDDGKPGELILNTGRRLEAADIGTLAALGKTKISVYKPLRIGIVSTGDELVKPEETPGPGQIRDVNTWLIDSMMQALGFHISNLGFIVDDKELLAKSVIELAQNTNCVLVSGGTSAGQRDQLENVVRENGQLILHGLAVKPGKPTLVGRIGECPVFGLPGNPVAAYFITKALVEPFLLSRYKSKLVNKARTGKLAFNIPSNHGREEFVLVKIIDNLIYPIPAKSGLISNVSRADGYLVIPRNQEGLSSGATVEVYYL